MEIYENEHDQVDAVKRFFAENGKALVVGVILGVGALVGWRYWNNHQADSARGSSLNYENTVSAIRADQPQTLTAAEKFAADNKNTYGALAALEVAQQYVDKNELDKAAAQLSQGLAAAGDDNLKAVINLRLARIQVQQKKPTTRSKRLIPSKAKALPLLLPIFAVKHC